MTEVVVGNLGYQTGRQKISKEVHANDAELMPTSELLQIEPVTLATPVGRILGIPGVRVICTACGEEVLNSRQTSSPVGPVCQACAADRYYIRLDGVPKPWRRS